MCHVLHNVNGGGAKGKGVKILYLNERQAVAAGAADAKRCNDTMEEMLGFSPQAITGLAG